MPEIDSKRLPLRLKRWLTLLQNNGFKFSDLSRLFILHKNYEYACFLTVQHSVPYSMAGETKTSVASGNEHIGEKQLTDVLVNCTVVTVVGNFVALSFIEPTFLPLCGNTCAVEHNLADGEERDLVNIFASLSLKPSNLPARDAPWKWVTSPLKMCILS
ncbi:unnamed protein product [Prunus armeniaca]